tara:strand:- start:117 stop:548 length:432 start_codon:yes stop_codon:yes gene_type:complete
MSRSNSLVGCILKNSTPILEYVIERIAEDYELDVKILRKKYLNELKTYRKKNSKRKGIINAYAAFLGDKSIENELRKDNPDASFGDLSKLKGPLWKNLSDHKREKYKKIAKDLTEENLERLKNISEAEKKNVNSINNDTTTIV